MHGSILNYSLYENMNCTCIPFYPLYCTLRGRIKAKKCAVVHKVVINRITVLYEPYSTVMRLIGHIQHCYALNYLIQYSYAD